MTTTSQKGFKIGPPMPDIEGGSKIPRALNNPVDQRVSSFLKIIGSELDHQKDQVHLGDLGSC